MLLSLILGTITYVFAALPFPPLPRQYSATVSANFIDLGYTLAFNEFYDANASKVFTEGRAGDLQVFNLVDYTKGTVSEWKFQSACYTSNFSQLSTPIYNPSIVEFFTEKNETNRSFTYMGELRSQIETRGILCNKWREYVLTNKTAGSKFEVTNTTIDYYFAANSSFLSRKRRGLVPVRVWITGTTTNVANGVEKTTPIERVYDWVDVDLGTPYFVFQAPTGCQQNNRSSLMYTGRIPTSSTVTNDTPQLPPTPENFRMLLEVKYVDANTTTDVFTMNWWRSRQDLAERIDMQPETTGKNPTSLLYVYHTPALWDGPGLVYNNSGSSCFKLAAYDATTCASRTCATAPLSYNTSSPLNTVREGGFLDFWDDPSWFKTAVYQGRFPARGVNADVWMKFRQRPSPLDPTMFYAYNQYVYYYPRGWQFPGRNVAPNATFPIRMRLEGTVSCVEGSKTCNLSAPVPYSDLYDIFEFVPGRPSPASLQQPCPQVSCWDGIQNQGEAGVDCGMPVCPNSCPVTSKTLPFPKLSPYYITSVSANIINKNYTLSFNEFYDGTCGGGKGCLLTEGHYADLRQLELVDYQKNLISRWVSNSTCSSAQISKLPTAHAGLIGPSSSFFASASVNAKYMYYGRLKSTVETRGILCDRWDTFSSTITKNIETNVSISYYFAANTSTAQGSIPVRVWIKGTNANLNQTGTKPTRFEHVYDWNDWQNVQPPAFVFVAPTNCPLARNYSLFADAFLTTGVVVREPPAGSLPVPPLASSFRMVVEVKLNQGNKTSTLWTANWWLSSANRTERVDLQPQGSLGSSTLYYDYSSKALWDGAGTVDNVTGLNCYKIAFSSLHKCQTATCLRQLPLTPKNANPMLSFRDGSFVRLFAPDSNFFAGAEYIGRRSARGINADVWMKLQINRTVGDVMYNYYQYIYFFPQGWQFPGREGITGVPMRVINDGQIIVGNQSTPFNDVYDIFQFRAGTPDDVVFDGKCAQQASDFEQFIASINNPIGRILGGIVVALLLIMVIVAVVHCVRKRKSLNKTAPSEVEMQQ